MASRLSMHKQIANADFWPSIDWISSVRPAIVKVISPDGEFCANVKRVSPKTLVLARDIEDSGSPQDKMNRYMARSDWQYIDIIEGINEWKPELGDSGHIQTGRELTLCRLAHANGKKYCALSWAEGNPAEWWNDPAQWADFLAIWGPVLREADYIGLHEYWWPDWNTPEMEGWHSRRYVKWYDKLPREMQKPVIISEANWDGDINGQAPGKGWRDIYTPEKWAERMVAYERAARPEVVGITIYNWGGTPDWERFEWASGADALRDKILAGGGQPMPVVPRPAAIACARVALREWTQDEAIIAVAIAGAESAWNIAAKGDKAADLGGGLYDLYACEGYTSFGLWQINTRWHYPALQAVTLSGNPCDWRTWLFNAENNADIAHSLYVGRGNSWVDWSAYNAGTYTQYLQEAGAAVGAVLAEPTVPPNSEPTTPPAETMIARLEALEKREVETLATLETINGNLRQLVDILKAMAKIITEEGL